LAQAFSPVGKSGCAPSRFPRLAASRMTAITGFGAVLHKAVSDQICMVRLFLGDRRLRPPVLAIWVASFGGALHEPVTTFFLVEVGVTTAQMGTFGIIRNTGAWVLGPVYGWLLDKYSGFAPTLLSSFFCAVGCLLRGLAPVGHTATMYVAHVLLGLGAGNFWNVVGAYLACATDRDIRPLVTSAFFVQTTTLSLLGKLPYPIWDSGLKMIGIVDLLQRYRMSMSVCSIFCIFGVFNLSWNGRSMRGVKWDLVTSEPPRQTAQADDVSKDAVGAGVSCAEGARVTGAGTTSTITGAASGKSMSFASPAASPWENVVGLFTVGAVFVVQAAGQTTVALLWPLYVQKQFGWKDHEYAWLSLAGSVSSLLAASLMAACAQQVGAAAVATVLCGMAALGIWVAFSADAVMLLHVPGSLVFLGAVAALKPCLESLASLYMPQESQGRGFAILSLLNALGAMLGNKLGTHLFEASSKVDAPLPWFVQRGGGALPFTVVGAALLASATSMAVTLLPRHWNGVATRLSGLLVKDSHGVAEVGAGTACPQNPELETPSVLWRGTKPQAAFDG